MKIRTIEELHDPHIGHRKFAKVCDLLLEKGYTPFNIKEYNEKFKFELNGLPFEYSKYWKASAEQFVKYLIDTYNCELEIMKRRTYES